jgi:hypothetical protein
MRCIVITSIAAPNPVMIRIARRAAADGDRFIVIGDTRSPADFHLDGCSFFNLEQQLATGLKFAIACPTRHYARKNVGYLLASHFGAETIIETDDDNHPEESFFSPRCAAVDAQVVAAQGWVNVYRHFSDGAHALWPRGLPLTAIAEAGQPPVDSLCVQQVYCPIQQHLVDVNPDVDAIYRLTGRLPICFARARPLALAPGAWCPFNSQNTTWWPDAFPLTYLPAHCSFRMTDIWRSFVAQRIAFANGWHILFGPPTVWQERNAHDLMQDFADEVPGYLNNDRIRKGLEDLPIEPGRDKIGSNMLCCYRFLVGLGLVGSDELCLLPLFLEELTQNDFSQPLN